MRFATVLIENAEKTVCFDTTSRWLVGAEVVKPEFRAVEDVLQTVDEVASEIPRAVTAESVAVYRFIQLQFHECTDVREDPVFQFVFRSYYRLDNAGLTESLKSEFFKLLQHYRGGLESHDIEEIVRRLSDHKTLRNRNSLQFSFATKLAATVDPSRPIYDSFVAGLFSFGPGYHIRDFEQRLRRFMAFYSHLQGAVLTAIDDTKTRRVVDGISEAIPDFAGISREKQIDFIFWAAGKILRDGRLGAITAR